MRWERRDEVWRELNMEEKEKKCLYVYKNMRKMCFSAHEEGRYLRAVMCLKWVKWPLFTGRYQIFLVLYLWYFNTSADISAGHHALICPFQIVCGVVWLAFRGCVEVYVNRKLVKLHWSLFANIFSNMSTDGKYVSSCSLIWTFLNRVIHN